MLPFCVSQNKTKTFKNNSLTMHIIFRKNNVPTAFARFEPATSQIVAKRSKINTLDRLTVIILAYA